MFCVVESPGDVDGSMAESLDDFRYGLIAAWPKVLTTSATG